MIAQALKPHQEVVARLAEVPGFGADSLNQAAHARFPRPISTRSVSRIWRMGASVTISNRRVRSRTHGGVAGVGG